MLFALGEPACYGQKVSSWPNLSELVSEAHVDARVALIGAPLAAGSVTPGHCNLAPALLRRTLRRIGRYDVETGRELATEVLDLGDVEIDGLSIEQATPAIRSAIARSAALRDLTLLVGGNNAVTRPGLLALEMPLEQVGLITLDAHFDMRDLDQGLGNGNPVRALIEDGLPGKNIAQIGLASFANSREMHEDAKRAGNLIITIDEVRRSGIARAVEQAFAGLGHCHAIVVDCDIDVIDRSQLPAAPGARPGGMAVVDFFKAVRGLASEPRVRVIDLTEWDPPLDPTDLSALTAARWVAECLAGFEMRQTFAAARPA
jgi:arginase family enzyme